MKKWYLSKTILVAMAMEALAQVTMHMEEVKTAISVHTNTDAGLAFAITFPAIMVAMRFITTKPIERREKNVHNNGHNQKLHNDGDGGGDSDNGVVGLIPKTLSDSDTREGHINSRSKEAILRDVTARAKRAHRGKRRR